jgi:hypothetical protein
MALIIFKGATKKLLLTLKDNTGATIEAESVSKVEVFIRHEATKEEYVKFTTDTISTPTAWEQATIVDHKVQVCLDASVTSLMDTGNLMILAKVYQTDADFSSGVSVSPSRGSLAIVKEF